jgi:hypothetical protein
MRSRPRRGPATPGIRESRVQRLTSCLAAPAGIYTAQSVTPGREGRGSADCLHGIGISSGRDDHPADPRLAHRHRRPQMRRDRLIPDGHATHRHHALQRRRHLALPGQSLLWDHWLVIRHTQSILATAASAVGIPGSSKAICSRSSSNASRCVDTLGTPDPRTLSSLYAWAPGRDAG